MKYRSVDQIGAEHLGRRVTIRHRLDEGGSSDVLGILEHVDAVSVTVRDKGGERRVIGRADIVAVRVVRSTPQLEHPENPTPR
ncbi:MAG TPA: hypothetical protein VGB52_05280 [Actinomycetota bacterium]